MMVGAKVRILRAISVSSHCRATSTLELELEPTPPPAKHSNCI